MSSISPADRYKSLTVKQLQDAYLSTPLGNISLDPNGGALSQAKKMLQLDELRTAFFQNNGLPFPHLSDVVNTGVEADSAINPIPSGEVIYQIMSLGCVETGGSTATGILTLTDGSVHSPLATISLTANQITPITLASPFYINKGCMLYVDHLSGAFDVRVAYHTVSQAGA
jgi:hypothetical protein